MTPRNFSGWIQLATGLLTLVYQGYSMFHGVPTDPSHALVGAGLAASGVAHVRNGSH